MFEKLSLSKIGVSAIFVCVSMLLGVSKIHAADVLVQINASTEISGTVTVKYTDGTSVVSAPLWSGSVPTSIQAAYSRYQTCQYLKFPVQANLPYETMKSDVTIKFDVWSTTGEKIATKYVWNSDWNPLNGPTMVSWLECGDWLKAGNYNLIVTTQQTLSTNGLLSRYVEGVQTIAFSITAPVEPTAVPVTAATVATTLPPVPATAANNASTLPVTETESATSGAPKPKGVKLLLKKGVISTTFPRATGTTYPAVATTKGSRKALKCKAAKTKVTCATSGLQKGQWKLTITPSVKKVKGTSYVKTVRIK
jgi:hypothetical protein